MKDRKTLIWVGAVCLLSCVAGAGVVSHWVKDSFKRAELPPETPAEVSQPAVKESPVQSEPVHLKEAGFKPQASSAYSDWLLELKINHKLQAKPIRVIRDQSRALYVLAGDLRSWGLDVSESSPVVYLGEQYHRLDRFSGVTYKIDEQLGRLSVEISPDHFKSSSVSIFQGRLVDPMPANRIGGFFDYDLYAAKTSGSDALGGGYFEVGFFDGWGVLTSDFFVKRESDQTSSLRLATLLTKDFPRSMRTLQIGDTASLPGLWGSSLSFGGLQWGTNFHTQPGFVSFPLPAVTGQAVMPTVADIYVNNVLSAQRDLDNGPFALNEIPVVTGSGEVRVVTTDLLGRQQEVVVPYYASTSLLRKGLHDYSISVGKIRKNYGIASNDYGRLMVAATDRWGLTNRWTTETHLEVVGSGKALGFGSSWLVDRYGVLTAAVAGSHQKKGTGRLGMVQFTHQGQRMSYGLSTRWTSRLFDGLQYTPDPDSSVTAPVPPIVESQASIGLPLPYGVSWGMSYLDRRNRDTAEQQFLTMNLGKQLRNGLSINLAAASSLSGGSHTVVTLSFAMSIADNTSASLYATRQAGRTQVVAEVDRSLPIGSGFGYHLGASRGSDPGYIDAGLSAQSEIGTYSVEVARAEEGSTQYRAGASGGVIFLKGFHFTRKIDQSFAVIESPDYFHVPIYQENQFVGFTNPKGLLFVTGLAPYTENHISIHSDEIPLDAVVPETQFNLIPYYRSGLVFTLPIQRARHAVVTLKQANGQVVPLGAEAKVVGQSAEPALVGENGQLYLKGLSPQNQVKVVWDHSSCQFKLDYPEDGTDPVPDLGVVVCRQHNLKEDR